MAMYLRGESVDESMASARAAELLRRARLPVIGGLMTDIAGAEAAFALAQKLDGVIDHVAGDALTRVAGLMREAGGCLASFGEARNRADIVIMLSDEPLKRDPHLLQDLFPGEEGLLRPGAHSRELIVLGAGKAKCESRVPVTSIPLGDLEMPTLIAILAALVASRRLRGDGKHAHRKLISIAERLRAAAFPVFVLSPLDVDDQAMHAVFGIVRGLCLTTRAAILLLAAPGNGDGVNLCSAWTCGAPVRTRFVQGLPQHDPWLYTTKRLIDSGEADALLWIDALETDSADPPDGVPTVLLGAHQSRKSGVEIIIDVACAGRDHDAELYLPRISGIGMVKAVRAGNAAPTVAETLGRINALVDRVEARPC